jgi:hypothetical protein
MAERAYHFGLRIVNVAVDEAGHDQLARVIDHVDIRIGGQHGGGRADRLDLAVRAHQQHAVLEILVGLGAAGGVVEEVQHRAAVGHRLALALLLLVLILVLRHGRQRRRQGDAG